MENNQKWHFVYVTGKYIGEGWWLKISTIEELSAYHEKHDLMRIAKAVKYYDHDALGQTALFYAKNNHASFAMGLASVMSSVETTQLEMLQDGPLLFNQSGGYNSLLTNGDTKVLKEATLDRICFSELPEYKPEAKPDDSELNNVLGFVSPTGIYTHADFANHESEAQALIRRKNYSWDENSAQTAVDFLVYEKGYALINSPDVKHINVTVKTPTKAQRDTIYEKVYPCNQKLAESFVE